MPYPSHFKIGDHRPLQAKEEARARITLPMQAPRCAWCMAKVEGTRLCAGCATEMAESAE